MLLYYGYDQWIEYVVEVIEVGVQYVVLVFVWYGGEGVVVGDVGIVDYVVVVVVLVYIGQQGLCGLFVIGYVELQYVGLVVQCGDFGGDLVGSIVLGVVMQDDVIFFVCQVQCDGVVDVLV